MPEDLATVRTGVGGPGAWLVATLVGYQRLRRGEGAQAGEANEEGSLQLLGHEVRWVLPLHVALLELGIGKGDEAVGAL